MGLLGAEKEENFHTFSSLLPTADRLYSLNLSKRLAPQILDRCSRCYDVPLLLHIREE